MYILLILGVILIAIIMNNNKQDIIEKADEKEGATTIFTVDATHLGGNPNLKQNEIVFFQIRSNNVFRIQLIHGSEYEYQVIKPTDIIKCEFKTEQEIKKDVTVGRLIGLGVFAFALKKKTKEITNYMILDYKINSILVNCLFEGRDGQELSKLVYKINGMMLTNEEAITS